MTKWYKKMVDKNCCEWRELVMKCLQKGNVKAEYWESLKEWFKCGTEVLGGRIIIDDCQPCNILMSYVMEQSQGVNYDEALKKVNCCVFSDMWYDLYDKPNMKRFEYWLITFGQKACPDCIEKSRKFAIETGLMKSVKKLMDEEYKKRHEEWWRTTPDEEKAKEIVYFEYLEEVKKNPKHQVDVWSEMNILNPNKEQLKNFLLYKALQKLQDEKVKAFEREIKEDKC